jgi:hypothetical protein
MRELTQRQYNKIFTGTNQTEGYDKIYLGYEGNTTEITLKKDKTTFFHMPFFATPQKLTNSSLIADGAVPGIIPALSDRIFKKQGGYGKSTPWGDTSQVKDGTWLCSWLYASINEPPQWLDRYYDPGRLSIDEALESNVNVFDYVKSDSIYYDVPSEMILDPGVWYQYFHQGENTAEEIVKTFAGPNRDRLRLDIENWSEDTIDLSNYKNSITIKDSKPLWFINFINSDYRDRNALNFNHTDFINCQVAYNDSYCLENEFTTCFWVYQKDWTEASYTQLMGNLRRGGYGIYYDNLKGYPYFAIPETNYGHFYFFNQELQPYFEKNTQLQPQQTTKFIFTGVNLEHKTIAIDENTQRVYKYNHLGDILSQSRTLDGGYYTLPGIPKTAIIDGYNNTTVITTSGTFIFDSDLILLHEALSGSWKQDALAYDFTGTLTREASSIGLKFDNQNNKWSLKLDGYLYYNDTLIYAFPTGEIGTCIAVSPDNNIWVITNTNTLYIFDSTTLQLIRSTTVGIKMFQPTTKNLSFLHSYDRKNNTNSWYGVLVDSYEKNVYFLTLTGAIKEVLNLVEYLNILDPITAKQDPDLLTFTSQGDFTGYELKRIFHSVLYDNRPQLQFKVATRSPLEYLPVRRHTLSVPIDFLSNNNWHLITCVYQNRNLKIYVNTELQGEKTLPLNNEITYLYKNDFFVGTPTGKTENFNYEVNSHSLIWNGGIDSIRIFDYAINPEMLIEFIQEKIITQDIVWNIPTAPLQYIESIERFFKHRLPGHKSQFFKIKLSGLKITDPELRSQIEKEIKEQIIKLKPAYSQLLSMEWLD